MTFMDEIDGEAYRVQITNVYESKDNKSNDITGGRLKTRSKSLLKLIEVKEQEKKRKRRTRK